MNDVIETVVPLFGACVFIGIAGYLLIYGEVRFRGGQTIRRADEPLKYWCYCMLLAGVSTWLGALGILRIVDIWWK